MSRLVPLVLGCILIGAAVAVVPSASAAHMVRHVQIASFDGTLLATTLFVPEGANNIDPPSWILMTHGWAGKRQTEATGRVLDLLDAGYAVLTWDSRGFGASGGEVMLNSPDFEVRDVSALVSYIAHGPYPRRMDGPNDPRIGMTGGSYAGGIQLLAAALDERIDVIAPEITWNDLNQALAPNGVPKLYWTSLLFGAGAEASCLNARNNDPFGALSRAALPLETASTGCQTPLLALWYSQVHSTGGVPDNVRAELALRSPATYMEDIDVPTLLIQGYPDTLFDVGQAVANYQGIKANGAPVKLWLYDGGHAHPEGPALPNTQASLISPLVVTWMDRYLKGDTNVDTGHKVEYFVDGEWRHAPTFPLVEEDADRSHHIPGLPSLVQGPVVPGAQGTVTALLMEGPAVVSGSAHLSFYAAGTGPEGIVFASLWKENETGAFRLGDQVQPFRFSYALDEGLIESDLIPVAAELELGDRLLLRITSSDPLYDGNRVPGFVNLEDITVRWQAEEP